MKRAVHKQTNKQTNKPLALASLSLRKTTTSPKTVSLLAFLQDRVATIEKIKYQSHAHPLLKEWDRENRRFLDESLGSSYLARYRLILFSEPTPNGFVFRKPSVSWKDKEYYQRGLQRARIFFKGILMELKDKIGSRETI